MSVNTASLEIEIKIARKSPKKPTGPVIETTSPRVARIARLMALAIKFEEMVRTNEVRDYADLARLGYVSRARMTQIMNLLNLAPNIQEALLWSECGLAERQVRKLNQALWRDQIALWRASGTVM
jgi:hypothetical protein